MLVGVRQRQVGQVGLVLQVQRAHQVERPGAVGQNAAVRQHHAAGRATGAGGVDQARQCGRRDQRGFGLDVVLGRGSPISSAQWLPSSMTTSRSRPPDLAAPPASDPPGRGMTRSRRGRPNRATGAPGRPPCWSCRPVRHRADRHQRGLGDRELRAVFHAQQDPVTGRHAGGPQVAGAGCRHAAELAPGDGMPFAVPPCAQHPLGGPASGQGEHHSRPGSAMSGSSARILSDTAAGWACPLMLPLPSLHGRTMQQARDTKSTMSQVTTARQSRCRHGIYPIFMPHWMILT